MSYITRYPVRSFLDVSTAHLTIKTQAWLANQMGLPPEARVVVGGQMPWGWFLWVPASVDETIEAFLQAPHDLNTIMACARGRGCEYVLLDADAADDVIEGLPVYSQDMRSAL